MKYDIILKELKWDRSTFSSVFLTILQIFSRGSYVDPRSSFDQRWSIRPRHSDWYLQCAGNNSNSGTYHY